MSHISHLSKRNQILAQNLSRGGKNKKNRGGFFQLTSTASFLVVFLDIMQYGQKQIQT